MDPIIEVNNLSKKYRITSRKKERYNTLRDDLVDAFKKPVAWLAGKKETSEDVWALKDVSFSVEPGEVIGLIGPNGAGKSTLLKILTRITPPSEGNAIIKGRVGSLLEVGTGFHPELTGRENIYLNGAILGMKKSEIAKKFDEIVAFSGIDTFLDTPLKRYSSGMNVRLAFSVAAHLDADILLVDEVLAVGDAAFQRKSLGKMEEITKNSGRTIIFVSHNMGAIQHLCKKCILLEGGQIKMIGPTQDVVNKYLDDNTLSSNASFNMTEERKNRTNGDIRFTKFALFDELGKEIKSVYSGQNIQMRLYYKGKTGADLKNVRVNLSLDTPYGERITSFYNYVVNREFGTIPQNGYFAINAENFPLAPGLYPFTCYAMVSNSTADWVDNAGHIEVANDKFFPSQDPMPEGQAMFYIKHGWDVVSEDF